jgi:hypothetical protein
MLFCMTMISRQYMSIISLRFRTMTLGALVIAILGFQIGCHHALAPTLASSRREIWVDAFAPPGGDGSPTRPLKQLPGLFLAADYHLRSGVYEGPFEFPDEISVEGHGQVVLTSRAEKTVSMHGGALKNLLIQGGHTALSVESNSTVHLELLELSGFSQFGVQAAGATINVINIRIDAQIPDTMGMRLNDTHLTAKHVALSGSLHRGLWLTKSEFEIDALNSTGPKTVLHLEGTQGLLQHANLAAGTGPAIVLQGSTLRLHKSEVLGFEFGVLASDNSSLTVSDVRFASPLMAAISALDTKVTVRKSVFLKPGSFGALQLLNDESVINEVVIKDARDAAMVIRKGQAELRDVRIEGVTTLDGVEGHGIQVRDALAVLSDISIQDCEGASVLVSHFSRVNIHTLVSHRNRLGALLVDNHSQVFAEKIEATASRENDVVALEQSEVNIDTLNTRQETPMWADCTQGAKVVVQSLVWSHETLPPQPCVDVKRKVRQLP